MKTLFGSAAINRKLPVNLAARLTIKADKRQRLQEKGFVEAEVHAILSAALHYFPHRERTRTTAAK
ncbi:hypothetical protein [Aureimonas leprariae]|uniref:Uncharacterized protein n=1 Tax=Plantimonas leprariae TaxID=2615207 RepID=A0A7V7PRC4_9HYPH|nr:hypothetical protein [Aureimonas leprariae]KAB0681304.1 hypothetical protein F6X38_05285 [Aureimonas leprariae]